MQAIFQGMLEKDAGPVLISMCSPMGFEFVFLVCCCLQAPYLDIFSSMICQDVVSTVCFEVFLGIILSSSSSIHVPITILGIYYILMVGICRFCYPAIHGFARTLVVAQIFKQNVL